MIGTADIDRSENMCTTSKTGVSNVAVAIGQKEFVQSGGGDCETYVPIFNFRKERWSSCISLVHYKVTVTVVVGQEA